MVLLEEEDVVELRTCRELWALLARENGVLLTGEVTT